ncbi:MAG TPA: ATP-binding protein [Chloroflexota bacterium]|nr:ATP-binding protein [Chloroflexota bacterium]
MSSDLGRLLETADPQSRLFQLAVEHSPALMAVLRGLDLVFELVNPAFEAASCGRDVLGRPFSEAYPELADEAVPILQRVLCTGEPFHGTNVVLSLCRSCSGVAEERFFNLSCVLVESSDRREHAVLLVGIDTTEAVRARRRVEEMALEAQSRAAGFRDILDNMVDAVFVCNLTGRVTLANSAAVRLLGLNSVEELDRAMVEFPELLRARHMDGSRVSAAEQPLVRALAGETVVEENRIIFNPQTQQDIIVRSNAAPIRAYDGTIVGAVSVSRDITDMAELDILKDAFISVAAHELKTPVAVMKGYAQALLRCDRDVQPPQRKMLEAIDRGAGRIDRIVNDLLDISRLQMGRLDVETQRFDLHQVVAHVADRLARTTDKHRLVVAPSEAVLVHGDRDRIEQVLSALVDNAIKYSPKGGDVLLAVTVEHDEALVSAADQGVGIPREKQSRIFQRFYRAHTGTCFDYGGMGVGLYLAREIVSAHGGRMWFESVEGRGSVFHFSLPL